MRAGAGYGAVSRNRFGGADVFGAGCRRRAAPGLYAHVLARTGVKLPPRFHAATSGWTLRRRVRKRVGGRVWAEYHVAIVAKLSGGKQLKFDSGRVVAPPQDCRAYRCFCVRRSMFPILLVGVGMCNENSESRACSVDASWSIVV